MKKNSILEVPMFHPRWKKFAYVFFPLPILIIIGMAFLNPKVDSDGITHIIFGFWAIGFGILNLTREKVEDEMIRNFRLQAFQTGFFWLICGLSVLMVVSYIGSGGFNSNLLSVFTVLFLLNVYVYAAFQYQKYTAEKEY